MWHVTGVTELAKFDDFAIEYIWVIIINHRKLLKLYNNNKVVDKVYSLVYNIGTSWFTITRKWGLYREEL